MKQKLFEGQSKSVVIDNLEGMCHSKQNMVYQKALDEQSLQREEKEFASDHIKLAKIKAEFEKVKDEFKDKMKTIEQMLALKLEILKNKAIQMEGEVYLVDDQEEGMMGYYDNEGNLINARRLTPDERQTRIGSLSTSKAANQ